MLTFDKDEITIGRVSGNDIVLAKGNISKRHTRLTKRDGAWRSPISRAPTAPSSTGARSAGPTAAARRRDRIYVGDFLIGIDGPGAGVADRAACTARRARPSAARRLPVPPPPPPPRAAARAPPRLPTRTRPRRRSRRRGRESSPRDRRARGAPIPPPPPPPPPRRPADAAREPLAGPGRREDAVRPAAATATQPSEDTGNVGLFQHTRRRTDDEDAEPRRAPTGNRPGAGGRVPAQAPAFGGATGPVASVGPTSSAGVAPGLEALLADPAVTQILITGPDAALVDRGSGLRCTTRAWAIRTRSPTCSGATRTTPIRRLRPTIRSSTCGCPTARASRRRSRRRRPPASSARSAAPCCPSAPCSISVPGGNKDVQALLETRGRRRAGTCWSPATRPRDRRRWRALGREVPADRRVVAIGARRAGAAAGSIWRRPPTWRACCAWRRRCGPITSSWAS